MNTHLVKIAFLDHLLVPNYEIYLFIYFLDKLKELNRLSA